MKKIAGLILLSFLSVWVYSQVEVVNPILTNPSLYKQDAPQRAGTGTIDSTFTYIMDTIDVPVWDDFSINKFEQYDADFGDANVSSQLYYQLMDASNTVPQDPALIWCDSTHAHHDTISVVAGIPTTSTEYFGTGVSVWVNDLTAYPVEGELRTLFNECYVLVDSVIDGVPDPTQDTIWYNGAPNEAPDYVQDSANVFTVDVNDPNRIWVDQKAYHNYRFAVNPWSLGVATLDGVDSTGMPYDFANESAHEIADYLTSKPINLYGKTDVYLTFLYQAEGHGNMPEAEDSLILEFWLVDSARWYPSGWFTKGEGSTAPDQWDTVHWAIGSVFLDDGFRFRFKNWASTSGALDHWHIDYVNLKDNDLPSVSNFSDLAIAYPINSLLKDYTHVPWDHFKNAVAVDKMVDSVKLKVYNSDLTPTNFSNGQFEASYGGIVQAGTPYVLPNAAVGGGWTGNWEVGLNTYPFPVGASYVYDQSVTTSPHPQATFDVKVNIAAAVSGSNQYDVNDTTYFQQFFGNYYAYDDGSAEAAYGLNGSHAMLAYKFDVYEPDTLTGILMSFVPSVNDMSTEEFLITIWDDNGGEPGDIIYQDDYFNTNFPVYGGPNNAFHYYEFMEGQVVEVDQTFYVGMEQLGSESLNLGMDRNIPNSDKIFYVNTSGNWVNSGHSASLMIRPVFSTALNYTLSEEELAIPEENSIAVFPNPTNNLINIRGLENSSFTVTLFDMSGRAVISESNTTTLDLFDFEPGIYLIRIEDASGDILYTDKIIRE